MTKEQITAAGIKMNAWVSLEGVVNIIGFNANKNQHTSSTGEQYYFDSENGLLYIRLLSGYPEKYDGTLKDGYTIVSHGGKDYQIKIASGGIDSKLGKIHAVYNTDEICAIYN